MQRLVSIIKIRRDISKNFESTLLVNNCIIMQAKIISNQEKCNNNHRRIAQARIERKY